MLSWGLPTAVAQPAHVLVVPVARTVAAQPDPFGSQLINKTRDHLTELVQSCLLSANDQRVEAAAQHPTGVGDRTDDLIGLVAGVLHEPCGVRVRDGDGSH